MATATTSPNGAPSVSIPDAAVEALQATAAKLTRGKAAAAAKAGGTSLFVELPRPNIQTVDLTLVGTAPLITHKWSTKAKSEILAKQMKKAQPAKEAKDPQQDFLDSLYVLSGEPRVEGGEIVNADDCTFGFPAIAFKNAAVSACTQVAGITKVLARGAFHVVGEYVSIDGKPEMREDMVRIGMGVADIRFRGEFKEWSTKLQVSFNAAVISPEQVAYLFQLAGFAVGVGEWRPERDGDKGTFRVGNLDDLSSQPRQA